MTHSRWVRQWRVPSRSDPHKEPYTVSADHQGRFACSCPRWKFARAPKPDCDHIAQIKAGASTGDAAQMPAPEPNLEYCYVREVTPVVVGGVITKVRTPLLPIGDDHFCLTLLYDLAQAGVRWPTLRERYRLPKSLTPSQVADYIRRHGRKIYGPWAEGEGFRGFEIVRVE